MLKKHLLEGCGGGVSDFVMRKKFLYSWKVLQQIPLERLILNKNPQLSGSFNFFFSLNRARLMGFWFRALKFGLTFLLHISSSN